MEKEEVDKDVSAKYIETTEVQQETEPKKEYANVDSIDDSNIETVGTTNLETVSEGSSVNETTQTGDGYIRPPVEPGIYAAAIRDVVECRYGDGDVSSLNIPDEDKQKLLEAIEAYKSIKNEAAKKNL